MFSFFFFSSRRRHTRSTRDWSSDVCSSDLGSETTSALVPPRLRPYCPANSKAPKPKMISGARNFRKFREYVMALRPSTIRLQVLRLTDGHAKFLELLSKADVFVFLVARFHLNPPICCSLSLLAAQSCGRGRICCHFGGRRLHVLAALAPHGLQQFWSKVVSGPARLKTEQEYLADGLTEETILMRATLNVRRRRE